MDELAVKALIIGISIFVTLIITTMVIGEFFQINQIYKSMGETDISFEAHFNELDKFNDATNEFNGLDVKNYIKKYENNDSVVVCVEDVCEDINLDAICNTKYNVGACSDQYSAKIEAINNGYKITFSLRSNLLGKARFT